MESRVIGGGVGDGLPSREPDQNLIKKFLLSVVWGASNVFPSGFLKCCGSRFSVCLLSRWEYFKWLWGFPACLDGKESACNAEDPGLIPGSGRSPGEGNGDPLQYSCLENSMDRGVWWAAVYGVTERQTLVIRATNILTFTFQCD